MPKVIEVAVAVISHQQQFLLGYRHAHQHQGNRYEFVGGKIEPTETPKQGLIREVYEEIGCDISQNCMVMMGVIRHAYAEKTVALHSFHIELTKEQFAQLQHATGNEGQHIMWVNKTDLLNNRYPLPTANARILDWLRLPNTIFISQELASFTDASAWLDYYSKHLPPQACFYLRPQCAAAKNRALAQQLLQQRPDILPLLQYAIIQQPLSQSDNFTLSPQQYITHLTHQQLMTVDFAQLPTQLSYFASCHDKNSLSKLNKLARSHTVMGGFLSPVLATPTHPTEVGLGWQGFQELAEGSEVPIYALGGMRLADINTSWQHGAHGIAGIRLLAAMAKSPTFTGVSDGSTKTYLM